MHNLAAGNIKQRLEVWE